MTKHRRLFLNPGNPNATVPCPDFCVPTCPPGCGPYGTGYSEQPPPPRLPALQNSASGSSKQGEHISPLAIGIVIFLAACFIVITLYLLTARCRRRRWDFLRRRRGELRHGPTTTEQFLDENHGPAGIDYPIWYINTIGLRPAVIDSITIFRYSKDDRLIEGKECAVCLTEFQDDDALRLLPKCSHAFHVPCIDTWLRSHVNCPVCRAGIVSGVSASIPVTSNALNLINLGANEDSQVLNTNLIGEDEIIENRPETGEVDQMVEVQERKMEDGNGEEQSEPVRRSVSVDSSLPLHLPTGHVNDT